MFARTGCEHSREWAVDVRENRSWTFVRIGRGRSRERAVGVARTRRGRRENAPWTFMRTGRGCLSERAVDVHENEPLTFAGIGRGCPAKMDPYRWSFEAIEA
jgi:hypothetical protein